MKLQSTAQAGQDVFAYEVTGQRKDGFVLDLGSYNVVMGNNSYALERIGWRCLMVDLFKDEENLHHRTSPFLQADARKVDWLSELKTAMMPMHIDYLSLDCDEATHEVLDGLPLNQITFDVITLEHDAYRFGNERRDAMRSTLLGRGYDLICADVKICIPNYVDGSFEDWYCSANLSRSADRFRCENKYWQEIVQ